MVLMLSMLVFFLFFFFKQKTAYEMRISDWSSDVCSSDLDGVGGQRWWHTMLQDFIGLLRLQHLAHFLHALARESRQLRRGRRCRYGVVIHEIGRASCRERVCQYV